MLSRLSFRAKLLLVLFVPFLALVIVAAAGLSDRFSALDAQQQYGDLSSPLRSLDELSRALENESVVSSWFAAAHGSPTTQLADARRTTDIAVRKFRADKIRHVGVSDAVVTALNTVTGNLRGLSAGRDNIDHGLSPLDSVREFFLGRDDEVLRVGSRVASDLADPEASASLTRVLSLEREEHEFAREASVFVAVLASGTHQDFNEWVSASAAQLRAQASFVDTASRDELVAFYSVGAKPVTEFTLPSEFPKTSQKPGEYYDVYRRQSRGLDDAIAKVDSVIRGRASASAASAASDIRVYGAATVIAMLLTVGLMWFVSRTVIRPLRRLTRAAREMSRRRLPQLVDALRTGGDVSAMVPTPIQVASDDELGELARAFRDVEAVTMEVALEQSRLLRKGMGDLFVNLARRNQGLLERQLQLLDDLERNEHDPSALDALFKLDHMATRMRRNAESLLVLSGSEQPRQWHDPIALLDVVRAAAAEIADFPRVEVIRVDAALSITGRAVADVAHMLAELLENATSCSPPDRPVVVSGAATAQGFVLAVSDQGIGMPMERIVEANRLLAHPPVVGLALSRALGLHVVGLLAARHGITVELRPGTPNGLVALVLIPDTVLEHIDPSVPAEPRHRPGLDTEGGPGPLGARSMPAARPSDEPPVEEWRREGLGEPVPEVPASHDVAQPEDPVQELPVRETHAPTEMPLPLRVPGNHLRHRPTVEGADVVVAAESPEVADVPGAADPLRPYRVQEFLTRHAEGKKRGRAEDHVSKDAP
ncbi:MAG TPA: nitrate- and nitrite sensing domain-containing protein [Acidimicrobiia bacterium]